MTKYQEARACSGAFDVFSPWIYGHKVMVGSTYGMVEILVSVEFTKPRGLMVARMSSSSAGGESATYFTEPPDFHISPISSPVD